MAVDANVFRITFLSAMVGIVTLGFGWFLLPSDQEKQRKLQSSGKYTYKRSILDSQNVENRPKTKDELIMDVLRNAAESKDPIYRPKPK